MSSPPTAVRRLSPPATSVMTREHGRTVVWLWGELDVGSADLLSGVLAAAISGHDNVVVDLEGVTFIDASGVHLLASAIGALRRRHRSLSVRRASRAVQRVIDLARAVPASTIERHDYPEAVSASA